jgi:hypothetical protein
MGEKMTKLDKPKEKTMVEVAKEGQYTDWCSKFASMIKDQRGFAAEDFAAHLSKLKDVL